MTTQTIDAGTVYITDADSTLLSGDILTDTGKIVVKIDSGKFDFNYDNSTLVSIPVPVSKGSRASASQATMEENFIINLSRFKLAITVHGMLTDDASESAFTKSQNLIKLAEGLDTNSEGRRLSGLSIIYGRDTDSRQIKYMLNSSTGYGVFITKLGITETPGGYSGGGDTIPEKKYDVQIQMIVGTEK